MKLKRVIHDLINDREIADKMILLTGPRQTGKTTAAKDWLKQTHNENLYYNWDSEETRRSFRSNANFFEAVARTKGKRPRIVFDEIHKINNWKTILKGYYDSFKDDFSFFVTGSARLEFFQRSGDSMLGRYHLLHLGPLIPNELETWGKPNFNLDFSKDTLEAGFIRQEVIDNLLEYSGFPEPFIKQSRRSLNLWHREYLQRIVKEDLRDLTRINDFNRFEHLIQLLPSRVGSVFSLNNLRQIVGCSYDSAKSLLLAMNKLCLVLEIRPFSHNVKYLLTKEPKIYLTDWTQVPDEGGRFENFMAIQLKTFCDYVSDGGWNELQLHYIRDKQGHETDFLIVKNGTPFLLIEVKLNDESFDTNLNFFSTKIGNITALQVVSKPNVFAKKTDNTWIISANRFFRALWG